jgi:capsular exopolysaccharide synthesis family protein
MELLQAVQIVRRRFWLLLLTAALVGTAAWLIVRDLPPRYRAAALLQVDAAAERSVAAIDLGLSERLTLTYATLLNTRAVLEAAAVELGLPVAVIAETNVSAEALRNTQLMRVTVEDNDPLRAAALANAVGRVFAAQAAETERGRFADARTNLAAELAVVQQQIADTQLQLQRTPALLNPAATVQQQELLNSYRATYAALLQSNEEIRLAELQDATTIHVVDAALPPAIPLGPYPLPSAVLGVLSGLLLGALLAFAFELMIDRVTDQSSVERLVGTDVLAVIDDLHGRRADERLVALRREHLPAAEAFRMLRVRLEIALYGKPLHRLLITSSHQGEGKSTTAANLAVTFARAGKRVVLIDADLRRPSLHEFFNHQNLRGLTTALHAGADADLSRHLLSTRIDTLTLLPAGPPPADPMQVFSSADLPGLLDRLSADADLVIIDSPPLLQVADSTLLVRLSDSVVLVAMAGRTRMSSLLRSAELIRRMRLSFAGVVLTRASHSLFEERYGYGAHPHGRDTASAAPWWAWRRPAPSRTGLALTAEQHGAAAKEHDHA